MGIFSNDIKQFKKKMETIKDKLSGVIKEAEGFQDEISKAVSDMSPFPENFVYETGPFHHKLDQRSLDEMKIERDLIRLQIDLLWKKDRSIENRMLVYCRDKNWWKITRPLIKERDLIHEEIDLLWKKDKIIEAKIDKLENVNRSCGIGE